MFELVIMCRYAAIPGYVGNSHQAVSHSALLINNGIPCNQLIIVFCKVYNNDFAVCFKYRLYCDYVQTLMYT